MKKPSKASKIILAVSVTAFFAVAVATVKAAELYVEANPTPAEAAVLLDDSGEEIVTAPAIGSTDSEPVRFSLEPGFYTSDQRLTLSAEGAEKIVYTRDGADPRVDGKTYNKEITLKDNSKGVTIHTITAAAVYPDGSMSDTVTRSFLIGGDIANRFDCLVFSIAIDPEYLYNYEDGIFIAGKMRDDYLALPQEQRYSELQPTDPANWNQRGKAGERPAFVEVFEYDGTCVISQNCGLRIFGGWSRSNDQKNLRLYARSEYDEVNNRFRYQFFPDLKDVNGNQIVSAKKLSLRACANDAGALYLRDDMLSAAAGATGLDVKASRPAAIFLNGEYYGFAWLQEVFSEDYLDHKYAVEDGSWDILKGCEYMMIEDTDDPDWASKNAAWREMYDYAYKDLTDDETFAELCELIDVDNFLTYYAFNAYAGNGDWPNNNYKVYRYSKGSVEMGAYAPCDGKWRFMLYDTDFCLGLYGNDFLTKHMEQLFDEEYFGVYPEDWRADVHDDSTKYTRSDLLIAMCKRPDVRDKWLRIISDMSGYFLNAERISNMLDEYHELRLHELVAASEEGKANVWSVQRELDSAKDWITKRPYAARLQMARPFSDVYNSENYYTVVCEPVDGARINLSTSGIVTGDVGFDGWYFDGIEVPLSCDLERDVEFVSWEINGKTVTDRNTVISDELYGDRIEIKLNIKRTGGIAISEVAYKGSAGGDFIILKNFGDFAATTQGLTVSDGSNEFILPTMTIQSGSEVKMIGKNYSRSDALGAIELGFNLKEGETVTLKSADGTVLSELLLRTAHRKTSLKLDLLSGRYDEASSGYKTRILPAELPQWNWGGWGNWGGGWQ